MEPKSFDSDKPVRARLTGRVVSRGMATGKVFILRTANDFEELRDLDDTAIEFEIEKFDSALKVVIDQLSNSSGQRFSSLTAESLAIIDAQIAIATDRTFCDKIRDRIRMDRFGSQLALRIVTDEYVDQLRSLDDTHLQEKAADLQDVCDRLLSLLSDKAPEYKVPQGSVIVCGEIWPTMVIALAASNPAAFVTESGGWTSHAFILARELGIPAISGVKNVTERLSPGDTVEIDAIQGHISPSQEPMSDAVSTSTDQPSTAALVETENSSLLLDDGTELEFLANADSLEKCRHTIESGVREIGLLRSEYLFDLNGRLPDEKAQTAKYSEIAAIAGSAKVAIRTFDVSIGNLVSGARHERNPALGMRSIRLALRYERQFRAQLRSLIRANLNGNVSIVIPMVSGAADVLRVRALLNSEFESLQEVLPSTKAPLVGAMIELPSAVMTIDQILDVADFVCIGTNDLVQYTLGVDRDNEAVADWYQTLHPSIVRSIGSVVKTAIANNTPVNVCGEIAGSPFYLPLLVGLGVRRFSMNPSSMPSMMKHARSISVEDCNQLADNMLLSTLSSQNEKALFEFCFELWPDLARERVNFPPASSINL